MEWSKGEWSGVRRLSGVRERVEKERRELSKEAAWSKESGGRERVELRREWS